MDSRQRVLAALAGEKPDRVPFNFWMDRRLMADYAKRFGGDCFRVTHFDADVIETFPRLDWPRGPHEQRGGTAWQTGPLIDNWSDAPSIPLPDPDDDKGYELIRHDLETFPDRAIFLDVITPWGVVSGIRTFELLMTDMIEYPDEVKALMTRVQQVCIPMVERACDMGITALYLMEDLASATGLLFSPAMIREFCLDFVRPLADIARSRDIPVLWHTDGKAMDAFDMLIDIGVQAVNPLQPHLNDLAEFRRRYGRQLALYGGLDNCFIIPDGTPDDVRNHVRDTFNTVGTEGGLIFSTHDIPIHTPKSNIEAMVRTIIDECRYD